MPVVSPDWRDPASWIKARVAYGLLKDGDRLRFCRRGRSGAPLWFDCTVDAWRAGPDFRTRMEKELADGALLIAGLAPHRVMLRRLESPLADKAKSAEIWGTLLDAALPFSLEKCQVAFLPASVSEGRGLRCLAVAARLEDLRDVLTEWQALDLSPDLLMPEELMLPRNGGNPLWLGEERTVFATWDGEVYTGSGGVLKPGQREKMLERFLRSLPPETSPADWRECGPGAEREPGALETALAGAGLKTGGLHANLRARELAAPRLQSLYAKKRKTLKTGLLILLLMLLIFPLLLRHQLRAHQNYLRAEASAAYRDFTGTASTAPVEVQLLLARRYHEENRGELWNVADTLARPELSLRFGDLLLTAQAEGVALSHVLLRDQAMDLQVRGDEEQVKAFSRQLERHGWRITVNPGEKGIWFMVGEREDV